MKKRTSTYVLTNAAELELMMDSKAELVSRHEKNIREILDNEWTVNMKTEGPHIKLIVYKDSSSYDNEFVFFINNDHVEVASLGRDPEHHNKLQSLINDYLKSTDPLTEDKT